MRRNRTGKMCHEVQYSFENKSKRLENFLTKKRYGLYKVARLALTASNAAVAGTITRRTASSVNGTTTTPTTATTILAFVWLLAPRAHTNGVNRP